ncbi:DUF3784 domain-containing protein [Cytobacillus kochii]|uniref:DUF3784 domain-containing protein n=1 Tax=Cytobacillus kochii TaxID=859143 RepID=UPI0025A110A7|nr:DUF3784 domain-containing protein [Cytobacillus kochii]MDM5209531.1 DUF3784 domain-containing protein [Cytobacillus kochii]
MTSFIIYIIILIPFLIFAIVLSKGKGAWLIAGFNTMSDSEKAKYNRVALCKFMSKVIYGICLSILLLALSDLLKLTWLYILGMVLFVAILLFTIIYANTGDRFKK